jgi:hypothetical protein
VTAQLDLHEALRRYSYDHAIFCTYNFQADFFEEYCLEQFDSLETNNGITVIMDGRELDRLVSGPQSRWPRKANVRYLLHAARPWGRFHPKIYFLASKTRGLLVVGSSNLTRPGLTRNAEFARSFSFEVNKRELALPLFQSAWLFLTDIARRWPSSELTKRLEDLDADTPWLSGSATEPVPIRLLHNLMSPLLEQVVVGLEKPVHEVATVSPYFDRKPEVLDWLQKKVNPKTLTIFTQNGAPRLNPAWCEHPTLKGKTNGLLFSQWGEKGQARFLHAKALGISHGKSTRLVFGSANFTRAALLATPVDGNVEVVLALDDVPRSKLDLRDLFDPNGLAKGEPLIPFEPPADPPEAKYSLRIIEAIVDESTLRCVLDGEYEGRLEAVMRFGDSGSIAIPLQGTGADRRAELDNVTTKRADKGTTVVFLRGQEGSESNRVLLLNLKDVSTGGALRKERRVRDAQRSANQFAATLLELLRLKETDPLQSFLTYCDIPLPSVSRLRGILREPIKLDQVQLELRRLGARNLHEYNTLHEAVLGFCERHISRLARHARNPSIDAVPGCMHIVRSVAGVIATQIERFLAGLTHVDTLSIDEWYDCRRNLDQLLKLWIGLLRVVHTEWLTALQRIYDHQDIKEAIVPDLEPLKEFTRLFSDVRNRVLDEAKRFRVQIPNGSRVVPPFSEQNILLQPTWTDWSDEVRAHELALESIAA